MLSDAQIQEISFKSYDPHSEAKLVELISFARAIESAARAEALEMRRMFAIDSAEIHGAMTEKSSHA